MGGTHSERVRGSWRGEGLALYAPLAVRRGPRTSGAAFPFLVRARAPEQRNALARAITSPHHFYSCMLIFCLLATPFRNQYGLEAVPRTVFYFAICTLKTNSFTRLSQ